MLKKFDQTTLRQLVSERIAAQGLRAAARDMDVDIGTLRSARDGRNVQAATAIRLMQAMGLDLCYGTPDPGGSAEGAIGFSEAAGGFVPLELGGSAEALRTGFAPIPFHVNDPAARGVAPVAFSRDWLARQGWDPETLAIVRVPDDRMAPACPAGALALIDAARRGPPRPTLCAVLNHGVLRLCRYSRPARDVALLEYDNRAYDSDVVTGPVTSIVQVLGTVVWVGAAEPER